MATGPATLTSSMNLEARVALRAHSCHAFTLSFLTHVSLCWGSVMHSRHRPPIHAVRRALLSVGQIRCDDRVILLLRRVNRQVFLLFLDQQGASAASGTRNKFLRSAVRVTRCGQLRTSFRPREKCSSAACSAYRSTHALPNVAPPLTRASRIRW